MTNEQLESIRCYESVARIEWVRALPCVIAGCQAQPIENAHTRRLADGRMADSTCVVPMCQPHRALLMQHLGSTKFETLYRIDLALEALDVEPALAAGGVGAERCRDRDGAEISHYQRLAQPQAAPHLVRVLLRRLTQHAANAR